MNTSRMSSYAMRLRGAVLLASGWLGLACLPAAGFAAETAFAGLTLWADDAADSTTGKAAIGPSLLRPPASWSWDAATPSMDFATGVERRFDSGLRMHAGLSAAHADDASQGTINYRDYFLGMRYGAVDTRVWYLADDSGTEPSAIFYEAGWLQPIHGKLALSLRVGRYDQPLYAGDTVSTLPSLSLGASTTLGGFGLGLKLIDGGGQMFGGDQDMRLLGSISRPLK